MTNFPSTKIPSPADAAKQSDKEFEEWMRKPETKMLVSLIPPNEAIPDLVPTLLKSAFTKGFMDGSGFIVMAILDKVMDLKSKGE